MLLGQSSPEQCLILQFSVLVLGAPLWLGFLLSRGPGNIMDLATGPRRNPCGTSRELDFFPGFGLPNSIVPTASIEEALDDAKLVVVALPSHVMRQNLERMASAFMRDATSSVPRRDRNDTLMLMSDVIVDVLGRACGHM